MQVPSGDRTPPPGDGDQNARIDAALSLNSLADQYDNVMVLGDSVSGLLDFEVRTGMGPSGLEGCLLATGLAPGAALK